MWKTRRALDKIAVVLMVAAVGFGAWCLSALLACWFWSLGVVPFGAPPLTFWQAWGLGGLLLLVGAAIRAGTTKSK